MGGGAHPEVGGRVGHVCARLCPRTADGECLQ